MFKWPLNSSNFSWLDRLKICGFFLNPNNRWTQDKKVREYEDAWKNYTGAKYVVMVSSGSTANELIAKYARDHSRDPKKNIVVFPSITWQTSISPWIRAGFEPKFVDINFGDMSMDLDGLTNLLLEFNGKVHTVFVTSLIGMTPDVLALESICRKFDVNLQFDNCENSFGTYSRGGTEKHICSEHTSSTSNYFGHQTTTGGESGLIFTNSEQEYIYYLMNRNHGMVRSLTPYKDKLSKDYSAFLKNPEVDPQFDFCTLGTNYRNTDIAAFMGLLDFKRLNWYIKKREELFDVFESNLDKNKYILPKKFFNRRHVAFCLPIILKAKSKEKVARLKGYCRTWGIEYRPVISGNILRQTCYKTFGDYRNFPNAEHVHKYGFYVGLYPSLKVREILDFIDILNQN